MIKHEYNVLKPFTIYTDDSGNQLVTTKSSKKLSGSSYNLCSSYVDYEFPHKNIALSGITGELIAKKFIDLSKTIKRGEDRKQP